MRDFRRLKSRIVWYGGRRRGISLMVDHGPNLRKLGSFRIENLLRVRKFFHEYLLITIISIGIPTRKVVISPKYVGEFTKKKEG